MGGMGGVGGMPSPGDIEGTLNMMQSNPMMQQMMQQMMASPGFIDQVGGWVGG